MSSTKRARGALTGFLAGGAALLVALTGVAASAAPGDPESPLILPGTDGAPITGTVTVHKHEQGSEVGAPSNGLEQSVSGANIAGVTFEATHITGLTHETEGAVDFDLTTNSGWHAAANVAYQAATNSWTVDGTPGWVPVTEGNAKVADTGPADGPYQDAVFAGLPVGLYLFEETAAPAGVTTSAPWVMTVPLTHPTELDAWLYDIHVYPKNSTTELGKTVQDAGAVKVGDTIEWTITGDLPRVANPAYKAGESDANTKFLAPTAYRITDELDERLKFDTAVVTLTGPPSSSIPENHFTVTAPTEAAGGTVQIDFTAAGLQSLGRAASMGDSKLQVVLKTKVVSLGDGTIGNGIIANQALLFPNQAAIDSNTPTPSPKVESHWGDILIHKVDASDSDTSLSGAEFQVFATEGNARAGSDAITINGQDTFTTDEDGIVRISGLRYSNYANGETLEPGDDGYRAYWIVETKAPEGYELLAEPMEVIVDSAAQTLASGAGITEVENAPENAGFELPLTGGAGTAAFTLAGLVLVGVGILLARRKAPALS